MKSPNLHIYSADSWHGECYIIGNTEGLLKLRNAIDKALEVGEIGCASAFASDGEGFATIVIKEEAKEVWDKLKVHYVDDMAKETRKKDVIYPGDLICGEIEELEKRNIGEEGEI